MTTSLREKSSPNNNRLEKELETLEACRAQIQTRLQQLALSLGIPVNTPAGTTDDAQKLASTTHLSTSSEAYQTFVLEF